MSKKRKRARAEPEKRNATFLCSVDAYNTLCCAGYTKLSENPEIMAGVNKIADLVSSATIHLMENSENGDIRVRNQLSRKVDINPNRYMTRKTFISAIVRHLLLEGDGNAIVYPKTTKGLIDDLIIIPPGQYSLIPDNYGYQIMIGNTNHNTENICHVVINPDPM